MCYNLEGGYNCANFLLFCHPAYSLYTQRAIFFKKITKKKCKLLILGQYSMPRSIFSKSCPLKVPRHCRKRKFLYAYSSFFLRIPRIRGKREFWKFRPVCGTQNRLRICGTNICVVAYMEKPQRYTKLRISR